MNTHERDCLKILIIQPWLSYRGAETVSVELARSLISMGHKVKLATVFVDEKRPPAGVADVHLVTPRKLWRQLCQASPILYLFLGPLVLLHLVWIASRDTQILNPHNPPTLVIAAIVARLRGIRVVWTCHSLPESRDWSDRVSMLDYFAWQLAKSGIERWAVAAASCVIANSVRIATELEDIYGRSAQVLHPPLPEQPWRENSSTATHPDNFRILVVGRLDARKNQRGAIEALTRVREVEPGVELVIAGDGPLTSMLREYAQFLKVDQAVKFLGYVPAARLKGLYRRSQVTLIPAYNEPWGLTPFEALSAGSVPIVSSEAGAAEVIQKEGIGIVCNPVPEDMAEAILQALRNSERTKNIVERGQLYLADKLTPERYSAACEEAFVT
ncbi:MAG: glycosyltransferase family 4 protein [Anaerolineales bacterium]